MDQAEMIFKFAKDFAERKNMPVTPRRFISSHGKAGADLFPPLLFRRRRPSFFRSVGRNRFETRAKVTTAINTSHHQRHRVFFHQTKNSQTGTGKIRHRC